MRPTVEQPITEAPELLSTNLTAMNGDPKATSAISMKHMRITNLACYVLGPHCGATMMGRSRKAGRAGNATGKGKPMLVRIALISLLLSLPVSLPVWASPIADPALGSQLDGGIVTVTRFGGPLSSATFVAAGTGASATALGSAGFVLTVSPGDTALATWTLTNTDLTPVFLNNITAVTIDLTLSGISLFDSGSAPSTPDSGPGIPGVIHVAGVPISSATEFLPWPDPANLGDMFRAVSITFGAFIGPGATSSWMDDTDVTAAVPGPTSIILVGTGLLLLIRRWRLPCADPDGSHRTT
ncbi:MAG: hypothetical protein HYV93_18300 [Candidatus Rokubacteria bacterium]|nr:hypothetical protein [Candidatus Rokubacteria bacterium]